MHSDRDAKSTSSLENEAAFKAELNPKPISENRGALAFLHSREGRLGVLSMVLLIFQGTALSLVLRYSR